MKIEKKKQALSLGINHRTFHCLKARARDRNRGWKERTGCTTRVGA